MIINGDLNVEGDVTFEGTNFLKIASGSKLYLDGGSDTYFIESAANTVDLYTNGSKALTVGTSALTLGSGHEIILATTKKLKLNVGGTSYIYESAAEIIDLYANSLKLLTLNGTTGIVSVNTGIDFSVAAAKKLYLDGGANTYIYESAADTVGIYTNGTLGFQVSTSLVSIGSARDLAVTATKKLFLDGGGDTYLIETTANGIDIFAGGSSRFFVYSTLVGCSTGMNLSVGATQKIFLDGGGDTYLTETSANTIEVFTGGTRRATFGSSGLSNVTISSPTLSGTIAGSPTFSGNITFSDEVILPAIDPPTANRLVQKSTIKAYLHYTDGSGSVSDSFNISSLSDDDGDGLYTVNFDTNMGSINDYACAGACLQPATAVAFTSNLASSINVRIWDISSGTATDYDFYMIAVGDQ